MRWYIPVMLTGLLAGCSGTPDCGSADTLSLLDEIIEERFADSLLGKQTRSKVDYRVRNIRMLDHDRSIDAYQCLATFEITPVGESEKIASEDVEFDVYTVQDDEADFEIQYDEGISKAIVIAAMSRNLR
ncbi:MAG: hypothetical protein ACREP4_13300 [Stenotrophomonas sp.]|uniref:hypothetical protein n=1 Tax=Stenotrophomonas sp. TaxID=69392 RepID=UPI003D6C9856